MRKNNNNNTGTKWLDDLDNIIAENSKLTIFLVAQFLLNGLLIIGYMKMVNKIEVSVDLPKTIKEEGILINGKEYANELFFKMWGREDMEKIAEFNQQTIHEKMEYLKERMYPPYYYKYAQSFKDYEMQIATNLVSQKFTFAKENISVEVHEEGKKAYVKIKGFYNKFMDEEEVIKAQACEYKLGYIIEGGHIYVDSFQTNCK